MIMQGGWQLGSTPLGSTKFITPRNVWP